MTANQRRPGFRLPWASESEEPRRADESDPTQAPATNGTTAPEASVAPAPPVAPEAATVEPERREVDESPAATEAAAAAENAEPAPESSTPFLRDLVAAMRSVADEAREAGLAEIKTRADEEMRGLEAEAEERREALRARAEEEVSGVGEWARAEAERIRAEAEQRVAARRAELEQQLAADTMRTEAESTALRARVTEYERELDAFHAQLAEINDPAAFAAAAKRMPRPPQLGVRAPAAGTSSEEPATEAGSDAPAESEVHPAEEEVLEARLAKLDDNRVSSASAHAERLEPATTEVVVKGLGSFGAITGFRQSLAGQEGIAGVALSLGQSGEFVFRATHAAGFDVGAAIAALEGDAATVEPRSEGGITVTLDRSR